MDVKNILINYDYNDEKIVEEIPYNYIFDRENSIKARIAYHIGSLPRITLYNRISNIEYNIESFSLEVSSIVENEDYNSVEDFVNNADRLMKKYNIKTKKDYTLYWIYYNPNFYHNEKIYKTWEQLEKGRRDIVFTFPASDVIKKFYEQKGAGEYSEFQNIYRDVERFSENLDKENVQLETKILDDDENFHKLEEYKSIDENITLEITKTVLEVKFDINTDIYELFNLLQPSNEVPFSSINKYYKILKDFIPPLEWTEKEDDDEENKNTLYIRVLNTREYTAINANNYSIAELKAVHKKGEINTVTLLIESDINNELKEELVDRILNSFVVKSEEEEKVVISKPIIKELGIKGAFQIPRLIIYDLIIRDLAINNSLFSNFVYIDESRQVSKIKTNTYIYFSFNSFVDPLDTISASLNQMVIQPNDYKLINKGFKKEEKYIEIKIIKATNQADAEQFMVAVLKLLKLYEDQKKEVIEKYEKYIPDFNKTFIKLEKKQLEKIQRRDYFRDYAPNIYTKQYPKDCEQKKQPEILSDEQYQFLLNVYDLPKNYFARGEEREELKEGKKKYKPILHAQSLLQNTKQIKDLIPEEENLLIDLYGDDWRNNYEEYFRLPVSSKDKEILIYPRKDDVPLKYMSNKPRYVYIGVRDNRDPIKKALFPFVPCGFEKPSYKTSNKISANVKKMQIYYGAEVKEKSNVPIIYNITTNKFINENKIGEFIPKNISEFLHVIDNNKTNIYYRRGTAITSNSTLESISLALKIPEFTEDDKIKYLKLKRKELLNYLNEIKQTTYQYDNEFLIKLVKNKNQYISPRFFLKALEDVFDCYIVLFSFDTNNPDGYLYPPNFTQDYYDYKQINRKYVLLYENNDLNEFHTELIVRASNKLRKDEKTSFNYNDDIIVKIKDVFKTLYIKNDNNNIVLPDFKQEIISQSVDYFGKTRYLQFNSGVIIYTNPLPNLNIELLNINDIKTFVDDKTALNFLKVVDRYEPVYLGNLKIAYSGEYGSVKFYLPIKIKKEEQKRDYKNQILIPINSKINQLEQFNTFKRLSRYILEYVFYLFSLNYLKDFKKGEEKKEEKKEGKEINKKKEITDEYIVNFAINNFVFDPEFEYKLVKRIFDLNNNALLKNKKIVLPNIEVLKHVLYSLKLNLKNYEDEIKNYSTRKYIKYYYEDINDFDKNSNFTIISGKETLKHWITSSKNNYHITDTVRTILPPKEVKEKKEKKEKKDEKKKEVEETKEQKREELIYNLTNQHLNSSPYLFNNDILNQKLGGNYTFIIQAVESSEVGAYVCKVYQEKGYNIGNIKIKKEDEIKRYGIVVYNSNTDIKVLGDKDVNRLVLVYRIEVSSVGLQNEFIDFYNALLISRTL
jgi:hypothetical protein